jgi:hypothetical protein
LARFRLKTSSVDYPLAEGETLIGRAIECHIKLDNPLVSRRHARVVVQPDGVTYEDLGSTHGSRVNGEPVHGARPLVDGDRITIGITDLTLVGDVTLPPVNSDATEIELAGLIGRLCARGRVDEAERVGRTAFEALKRRVAAGDVLTPRALADAIDRALALAEATRKAEWANAVFDTAALLRHCFEDQQLERIYGLLFMTRPACGDAIDHYVRQMEPLAPRLNDRARYNLNRVRTLRQLTTAPASR